MKAAHNSPHALYLTCPSQIKYWAASKGGGWVWDMHLEIREFFNQVVQIICVNPGSMIFILDFSPEGIMPGNVYLLLIPGGLYDRSERDIQDFIPVWGFPIWSLPDTPFFRDQSSSPCKSIRLNRIFKGIDRAASECVLKN